MHNNSSPVHDSQMRRDIKLVHHLLKDISVIKSPGHLGGLAGGTRDILVNMREHEVQGPGQLTPH